MKKYQMPVMETMLFSKESIMSTSGEQDVLFDAALLDDNSGLGGN